MSVAQVILLCGRSDLLHRGVGCSSTSRPALIIRLDAILAHIPLECKRFFRTLHCSGPLFLLFRGWWCWSSSAGWPATDGAGVHIDGWEQGGVRGVFRSMQFPAVGLVVTYAVRPWELRRFDACGRGMVEDYTAAGRMPSCIKYIVFICAFCAKSPLVRMRSPVQIRIAAPENT